MNMLQSITLKGKVMESDDQGVTISSDGGLFTVVRADILEMTDPTEDGETGIRVVPTARIVFEALVTPVEAKGILSKEAVVEIVNKQFIYRGECECSRCTGGECECSRCTDIAGRFGSSYPGYAYRGECECSRCTGGECECSRCTGRFGPIGSPEGMTFRRRMP